MTKAIVLGAGMVGTIIAEDVSREKGWRVTVADIREESLARAKKRAPGIETLRLDLSDLAAVKRAIAPFDIVLGAAASHLGFALLRAVIESGKNYCDISFMPEDAIDLDALARERGVTAVVDCGVAPGMSNLLCGWGVLRLAPCERLEIYVGGLPRERKWPFQYKAGFAPADVVEEYTRPSRIVERGEVVVRPALSEPELMDLPGVGTVEAFNTDGLRSLAFTMKVPSMVERTLRWPGHIDLMRAFREAGLFGKEPIEVTDVEGRRVRVRPLDVTSAVMFPKWTYQPGEEDLTVMRVIATGGKGGKRVRLVWDLLDFYDKASGATSMSRTTAFPCAILARMIASGEVKDRGVLPPERLAGHKGLVERVMREMTSRGVRYEEREEAAG